MLPGCIQLGIDRGLMFSVTLSLIIIIVVIPPARARCLIHCGGGFVPGDVGEITIICFEIMVLARIGSPLPFLSPLVISKIKIPRVVALALVIGRIGKGLGE